jgi:hypothetical protein
MGLRNLWRYLYEGGLEEGASGVGQHTVALHAGWLQLGESIGPRLASLVAGDTAMTHLAEAFLVYGEDEEQWEAIVIRIQRDAFTLDGRSSIPAIGEIRCLDGRHVNRIDDNTLEIVETGQIVRRKD